MKSYSERSTDVACESQVAVMVLANEDCTDAEYLPLKPHMADESVLQELKARWHGRGLRNVAVMGISHGAPLFAFAEPFTREQVSAIADGFLGYVHCLLADGFHAAESSELERLYALPDNRLTN